MVSVPQSKSKSPKIAGLRICTTTLVNDHFHFDGDADVADHVDGDVDDVVML